MNIKSAIDTSSTPFAGVDRVSQFLSHQTRRQSVIAANLANLDTPGYRARDVTFEETIQRRLGNTRMSYELDTQLSSEGSPDVDGNDVELEDQIARLTTTNLQFRSLSELLTRRIGMLRYAATDGEK